ncbi:MAG TPA: molybdopterin dehydrogenase, partial [Candidatus Fimicola cottocaccae]|nr:molybdopterin dehydrogenase [Candidatus Fimicola cottocaccae]
CVYLSERITKTDFPVIAVCVSKIDDKVMASVGARPARAKIVVDETGILSEEINDETALKFGEYVAENLDFNSNMRGSAQYRKHIAKVLVKRAVKALGGE